MRLERILWMFLQSLTMSVLERLFEYKQCWQEDVEPLFGFLERIVISSCAPLEYLAFFSLPFQLQKKAKIFTTLVIPSVRR